MTKKPCVKLARKRAPNSQIRGNSQKRGLVRAPLHRFAKRLTERTPMIETTPLEIAEALAHLGR
jgi:hypothetical protein